MVHLKEIGGFNFRVFTVPRGPDSPNPNLETKGGGRHPNKPVSVILQRSGADCELEHSHFL